MALHVRNALSGEGLCTVSAKSSSRLEDVKKEVQKKTGIATCEQRLLLDGSVLKDDFHGWEDVWEVSLIHVQDPEAIQAEKEAEAQREAEQKEKREEHEARSLCLTMGALATSASMVMPSRISMLLALSDGTGNTPAPERFLGRMSMCSGLTDVIAKPIFTKLIDHFGRKPFLVITPSVLAFLRSWVGVFPTSSHSHLFDRMLLGPLFQGILVAAHASTVDVFSRDQLKLAGKLSDIAAYSGIGFILGPLIGSMLTGAQAFLGSALTFSATMLWIHRRVPETLLPERARALTLSDFDAVAFLKLFRSKMLSQLTLTLVLQSWGDFGSSCEMTLLYLVRVLHYGPAQLGCFATAFSLSHYVGHRASTFFYRKFSFKAGLLFGNFSRALGMLLMGRARNTQQALMAIFLWSFGHHHSVPVHYYIQRYGAAEGFTRNEIAAAHHNLLSYTKVINAYCYSNMFAWSTSRFCSCPGLPHYVMSALTMLAQLNFWLANPT